MQNKHNKPLLVVENLLHSYREGGDSRPILNGIDLQVAEHECIALLGRSGSGKSTLLNMLAGIDTPQEGRIQVMGQDINALSERDRTLLRRRHIGFVYQFFNLIPTLTVAENVGLPLELNGLKELEISRMVGLILSDVGLGDRWNAFPDQLSGGEQQRIAIARALIHNPTIVLADEPTGNLDAETGDQILGILIGLSRQLKRTLIIVTHSLEVAERADRILTLSDGILSERGELLW
ncbi:ABC transporter ATP-binding protein [Sedimenticola selenatireducens]|uniref:ABC transporter ATP-binding protein n=2 Tax=Sedimenticola TaxID=349742 RepID=A0A2N6D1V1_9GAMM|nr:ABC transporter ATP-binding protein [Sedimenticola selenatireducens]PLX63668.1 MAG: ABC transporter ATP-binding protein [Sedimenticola selenatireducens]